MRKELLTGLTTAFLTIFLGFSVCTSTPTGALVDGGFETGDFSGWMVGGPNGGSGVALDETIIPGVTYYGFQPSRVNVRSGDYAAYGVASGYDYLSLSQLVHFLPGSHEVGFYMGNNQGREFGIDGPIYDKRLAIYNQVPD